MNKKILLKCLKISKFYKINDNIVRILNNINFSLSYKEMIAIVGISGSGKSTLLHILAGLDKPSIGSVFFEGKLMNNLSSNELSFIRNNKLGFVYQNYYLLSDFTVLENTAMPLIIGGKKIKQANKIAEEMLYAVNLEKKKHYYPVELSGGEKQRVAIARALVNRPVLVLADEPTGNLDKNNTENIIELLKKLNIMYGTSFIVVTHNLNLAKKLNIQLELRNGKLYSNSLLIQNINY